MYFTGYLKSIFYFSLFLIPFQQKNEKSVRIEKMQVDWKFETDHITFTAKVSDDGWVAIGFNSENNIVGSNLIMINVKPNGVNAKEFYVVGAGNPKPISELGSKSQLQNYTGFESENETMVQFSIPIKAFDKYHFNLEEGKKIWLICAYSMEDDFDHHSRMRKHVEITL